MRQVEGDAGARCHAPNDTLASRAISGGAQSESKSANSARFQIGLRSAPGAMLIKLYLTWFRSSLEAV